MGGYGITNVWFDEANVIVVPNRTAPLQHIVKVIDVPCPHCGAAVGVRCLEIDRHMNWFGSTHMPRITDADAAQRAIDALL